MTKLMRGVAKEARGVWPSRRSDCIDCIVYCCVICRTEQAPPSLQEGQVEEEEEEVDGIKGLLAQGEEGIVEERKLSLERDEAVCVVSVPVQMQILSE